MSTWLIVLLVIVGVLLLLGLIRALSSRRNSIKNGIPYDIGDFIFDMFILDIIFDGDIWDGFGDGFGDIDF